MSDWSWLSFCVGLWLGVSLGGLALLRQWWVHSQEIEALMQDLTEG